MRRARPFTTCLCIVLAFALSVGPPALCAGDARPADPAVALRVDRNEISTRVGQRFSFRTTISNRSAGSARGLLAHLNVVSLREGVYVDPEDWSSHRTRYLAAIPSGGSTMITWRLQAVNTGAFSVYVAVLPSDGRAVLGVASPVRVAVAQKTTLDSGGILPLVVGIPALLGLAWGGVRARRR